MKPLSKACPSAVCEPGAGVIGIVNQEGYISLLPQTIEVTEEFIEVAVKGNVPEKRFRFTNKCVEGGCRQWEGSRCTIIDRVLKMNESFEGFSGLPVCSIRAKCRWYFQSGERACAVCPFIITDNLVTEDQDKIRITETESIML